MLVADVTNILSIHEAVGQIMPEWVSAALWNSQQKMKYPGR